MKNIRENFKPTSLIRLIIQCDKMSVLSDLSVIREYISDNKFSIKDFQIEFEEKVKDVVFDDEENRMQFDRYIENESEKYFDIYPKLFLNSIFITLYSYFEGKLKKLQQDLKKYNKKIKFTDDKKNGSYIDCYKTNLEIYYKIDFTSINQDWEQIKLFGNIRNAITHNNSNIKDNFKHKDQDKVKIKEKELLEFCKKNKSIEINEKTGDFQLKDEKFILTFCDYIEHCLLHIYSLNEKEI